ncbi:hypothetical protein C8F01DRAFT_1226571 [Mycena amicta]|nr:hypothetical protein C8F01DRAFT_1226571 [Mycena amicta]
MSAADDDGREARLLELINGVSNGISIPGVCLCVVLLAAVAVLHWNSASRPHLNRVSFRLLIYALVANAIFGMVVFIPMTEHNRACPLIAFLGVTMPMFSSGMFCCMALNLQLILVWGISGSKLPLGRIYLLATLFLCAACNIPPWIAGKYGWYAIDGVCWLSSPTPETQLHWLLGTHSVWMLLMALTELVSFVLVLGFMVRNQMRINTLRADTLASAAASPSKLEAGTGIGSITSESLPKPPILRYRSMIIRIGLYPLLACFLSVTSCICDVYIIMHPELTEHTNNIRLLDFFAYSLRPLLYGLLVATDPAFLRALRAFRFRSLFNKGNSNSPSQTQTPSSRSPSPPFPSLPTPVYRSPRSSIDCPSSYNSERFSVSAPLHREIGAAVRLSIDSTQTHTVPVLLFVPPPPSSESTACPHDDYKNDSESDAEKDDGLPMHRESEERERWRTVREYAERESALPVRRGSGERERWRTVTRVSMATRERGVESRPGSDEEECISRQI